MVDVFQLPALTQPVSEPFQYSFRKYQAGFEIPLVKFCSLRDLSVIVCVRIQCIRGVKHLGNLLSKRLTLPGGHFLSISQPLVLGRIKTKTEIELASSILMLVVLL